VRVLKREEETVDSNTDQNWATESPWFISVGENLVVSE